MVSGPGRLIICVGVGVLAGGSDKVHYLARSLHVWSSLIERMRSL